MFKEYLLLLLMGHIIGDFYAQTNKIAEKKKNSLKWVLIHGVLYFAVTVLVSIPVMSIPILILDFVSSFLHVLIDILKFCYLKRKKKEVSFLFVID